jgi:hypothetical protein
VVVKKRKPIGRPPGENPKCHTLALRVTKPERYRIAISAAAAELSIGAYLRRQLGLDKEATE